MKKLLAFLTCCIAVLSVSITTYGAMDQTGTYVYEVRDGKAVLGRYATSSNAVRVIVPEEVDGYPVIGLAGTFEQNETIEEVVIPDGVISLGKKTFSQCRNLEIVDLPDTISEIGRGCFEYTDIETITIPRDMTEIDIQVFSNCKRLKTVNWGESQIRKLGEGAFESCISLREIEIPDTVVEIGGFPFAYCDSLEELTIPSSVEKMEVNRNPIAFGQNLKRITNMTQIEWSRLAFEYVADVYSWFTTESGYEVATSLLPNTTIYRRGRDSSKKYVDSYVDIIKGTEISMENVNSSTKLRRYLESIKPESEIDTLTCEVTVHNFIGAEAGTKDNPNGKLGSSTVRVAASNSALKGDEFAKTFVVYINPTKYVEPDYWVSPDPLEDDYARRYYLRLQELSNTGVSMTIVNTEEQALEFTRNQAPDGKDDRLSIEVMFARDPISPTVFQKAVAGTWKNPEGENGWFDVWVRVKNTTIKNNNGVIIGYPIPILATPYQKPSGGGGSSSGGGGSSGGSSGGGSSSGSTKASGPSNMTDNGFNISKPSVTQGTWELTDGKWKLKLPDDSYASSQWANLSGKWYLMGADGVMLTDWQKVNGRWYLLGQDGAMLTGWQFHNGKWYYMEPSGEMVVGWKWILDKCYYMDSNGAMLADTITPDGYQVNSSGEWVQ